MNNLQFLPINSSVTSSPRFWPIFSQIMPFFASKKPFFSQNNAIFPRIEPTASSRPCPHDETSQAQRRCGCAVHASNLWHRQACLPTKLPPCIIEDAYQAADAGHPKSGRASSPPSRNSSTTSSILFRLRAANAHLGMASTEKCIGCSLSLPVCGRRSRKAA